MTEEEASKFRRGAMPLMARLSMEAALCGDGKRADARLRDFDRLAREEAEYQQRREAAFAEVWPI